MESFKESLLKSQELTQVDKSGILSLSNKDMSQPKSLDECN